MSIDLWLMTYEFWPWQRPSPKVKKRKKKCKVFILSERSALNPVLNYKIHTTQYILAVYIYEIFRIAPRRLLLRNRIRALKMTEEVVIKKFERKFLQCFFTRKLSTFLRNFYGIFLVWKNVLKMCGKGHHGRKQGAPKWIWVENYSIWRGNI